MGCVSSKKAVSVTPAFDYSGLMQARPEKEKKSFGNGNAGKKNRELSCGSEFGESGRASSNSEPLSFRLRNLQNCIEAEQVSAGWPAWLSAVAGEAIQGWVPLKADSFEKLEKIGQGTYSSVFKARETESGKIFALKKVRFDNFEPESVRFMAREILILRRLDHPNVIKLEGLITSRLSCSLYLVFEYMEHDITGLLSRPDVRFSESQIKCFMKQLLSGLDHCHSKGVMHRDIKGSNLLVNDEGILKVADFGLANFFSHGQRQPLTSRVVTLWYRPPELLLGSTDYEASVDLWSAGCVFAELLLGKPVLRGRTEVEQLHKIFKLCGSPPDEYWNTSRLSHATLFKPQQPYDSCLHERFKDFPKAAVNLIGTLLSVEPFRRGTASSALASEYFTTKPYACDPSKLPKYPPSKEIDAKNREDARRKKLSSRARGVDSRKSSRNPYGMSKLAPSEDLVARTQSAKKNGGNRLRVPKRDSKSALETQDPSLEKLEETFHVKNASQGDIPFSGPLQVSSSSGFAWARSQKDGRSISKGHVSNGLEPASTLQEKGNSYSMQLDNGDATYGGGICYRGHDSNEISKRVLPRKGSQFERPDSFDASEEYHSQELSWALYQREQREAKRNNSGFQDQGSKVEFSGPLLTQSHRVDELLERHERHIRQAVRKTSWFQRGKKHGK